jgi:hypothetical protein
MELALQFSLSNNFIAAALKIDKKRTISIYLGALGCETFSNTVTMAPVFEKLDKTR